MAQAETVKKQSRLTPLESNELGAEVRNRRLGLVNGLLIGLAIAIGAWGIQAIGQSKIPTNIGYGGFIIAAVLVLIVAGLVGWLTARIGKTPLTLLIWLVASILFSAIISIQSSQIRTLTVWLRDNRFWGRAVFQTQAFSSTWVNLLAIILAGFFLILLLGVLGLMQEYRLDGIERALGKGGRLSGRAILLLLLPMPLVAGAGFMTDRFLDSAKTAASLQLVNQAIEAGRDYEGDLVQLGNRIGLNVNAIRGVRDQMSGNYNLMMGEIDPEAATTVIVAHFDSGAWISCRIINEQLSFCFDAAPPYTTGFSSLITGEPVPDDCRFCTPEADEAWLSWLEERSDRFSGGPQIERLAQQGNHVLMRAGSESGDYAIQCWFEGSSPPVSLVSCEEVN